MSLPASSLLDVAPVEHPRHGRHLWHWIHKNWSITICSVVLLLLLIGALWPTGHLFYDPLASNLADRFLRPFSTDRRGDFHLLGADFLGRDMVSRLLYSGRYSLLTAVGATVIVTILGSIIGIASGYFGGWFDALTMRVVDALLALPVILIAIVLATIIGRGVFTLTAILALTGWADFTRVVRAESMVVSSMAYVEASRSAGSSHTRLIFRTLLPNTVAVITVMTTYSVARFILMESSISFLGMGVVPPASSWGGMVAEGRDYIFDAPYISVIPGLIITITVIAINFLGDALRDRWDPRSNLR
ncbi:MAG: ABC transporter permease [Thermomicrobiales bacterium]